MASPFQSLLDFGYNSRKLFVNLVAYVTLRTYGIELEFDEIVKKKYAPQKPFIWPGLSLDHTDDVSDLLKAEADIYKEKQSRRSFVIEKTKSLLTFTSLLIAIIGFLFPKYLEFDSITYSILSTIAITLLFNVILLLLVVFDVGVDDVISISQEEAFLDKINFQKSLLNQYRECGASYDLRTDFMVDVYRVARFCFLFALAMVFIVVVCWVAGNSPKDLRSSILRDIRSDEKIIDLLRGPKGDTGEPGKIGPQGPMGSTGLKGDKGTSISSQDLILELKNDPEIIKKIADAVRSATTDDQ